MDSTGQRIARKLAEKAHEAYRLKHPEMKVVPWAETTEGVREIGVERVEFVLAELARERDAGWVSVSERMPTEHGEYWVWLIPHPPQPSSPEHSVFLDFKPYAGIMKTYDSGKGMRFNCGAIEKPTHWMKFNRPAPPACGS